MVVRPKGKSKTTLLIGAAALLLVGGLIAYLEFAPAPERPLAVLTPEAKAYVSNLKLSDVTMEAKLNYFSQKVVEIQGNIGNAGDRPIQTVELYCVFRDYSGLEVARERVAIVNERMGGLGPGESKTFRLPFDALPSGWNQQLPQLVIASVSFS